MNRGAAPGSRVPQEGCAGARGGKGGGDWRRSAEIGGAGAGDCVVRCNVGKKEPVIKGHDLPYGCPVPRTGYEQALS